MTFVWKVSGFGEVDYRVYGHRTVQSVRTARETLSEDYYRSIYNGDDDQWQREHVARYGGIWVNYSTDGKWPRHMPEDVYRAFCDHCRAEHAKYVEWHNIKAKEYGPDWGELKEMDPLPVPIYFDLDLKTWVREPWFETAEIAA